MATGLKASSSVVSIGFEVTETGANTFTQGQVDLNMSPLDREVFVVLAVNLDLEFPDAVAGLNTRTRGALTTTNQLTMPNMSDANCIAVNTEAIRAAGFVDGGVAFTTAALETPPSTLDFIAIIATNDFFIQVEGTGNAGAKVMNGKLYGYRARATADIYAALVQSEVLSA